MISPRSAPSRWIGHDTVDLAQSPPVDGVKQRQAKVMWEKSFQWGQTAVRFNDESYMSPYFLSFLDLDMAIQTLLHAFHTKDFDHSKMKCMKCLHSRPFFLSKKLSQDSAKFISTAVLSDFFFFLMLKEAMERPKTIATSRSLVGEKFKCFWCGMRRFCFCSPTASEHVHDIVFMRIILWLEERLADFTDFFRPLKWYLSLNGFDDQERLWHLQRHPVARMHVSKKGEGGHIGAECSWVNGRIPNDVPRAFFFQLSLF